MLAPFGAGFFFSGPLSGHLSDRFGSRRLSTAGLLLSASALLLLSFVDHTTPYAWIAAGMALMGVGGGMFGSPNTRDLMSAISAHRRGIAAATNTMLMNTGQMLSISIVFPLVLSQVPQQVMFKVFLYGGGMASEPAALRVIEQGIHIAFLISCGATLVAALISATRPSNPAPTVRVLPA
jgi:MFS family permease